jgi:hypothetical protein
MRYRKPRYVVLILAIACTILALSCGLGAVAVRRGVVKPPNLNLQLGGVRLVGITSTFPDCTRLLAAGCTRLNQLPTTHVYTLWLFVPGGQNSGNRPRITRLLAIQVGE